MHRRPRARRGSPRARSRTSARTPAGLPAAARPRAPRWPDASSRRRSWHEEGKEYLREEVVDDEDEDAREHHRSRGRLPYPFGAAGGVEPEVAGGDRDDPAEDEG